MNVNLQNFNFFNLILMISSFANAGLLTRRIVGGHHTQASKFPHEVLIVLEPQLMSNGYGYQSHSRGSSCGGSVIAKDAVLTAAHCVPDRNPNFYTITGKIDDPRERNHPNFPKLTATQIITHEHFYLPTITNDVAIIKVQSNHNLPPIVLDSEKKPEGTRLHLAGWGTDESGQTPNYLKELSLIVGNTDFCFQSFGYNYKAEEEICVTGIERGSIFCQGDSGSPVVSDNNKLVGVVSYVQQPCSLGVGAIQRVSFFSNWIRRYAPNAKFSQQGYSQDQDSDNEVTPNTQERETNPYYRPQSQENNYHQNQDNYPGNDQNQQNWFNSQGQQQDQRYNPQQYQGNQIYGQQQGKQRYNQKQQGKQRYYLQQGYQRNQKPHQGYQRSLNPQSPRQGYQDTQSGFSQNQKPNQGSYTKFPSPDTVYFYEF